jgi:parallel beta-helix repeat protein
VDSGLTSLSTYYYRVTAYDAAAKVNESFYSDSIVPGTTTFDTSGPNAWYVNDASQAGDSWCSAIGYDTNHGFSTAKPKRTIGAVMALLTAGDTVYIDAGTYSEAVTIATDSVALIGAGQNATIISPGANTGCYATNRVNIKIRDLAIVNVTGFNDGVYWNNVARSEISGCSIANAARYGIYLNGAYGNTVYNNTLDSNAGYQIFLTGAATRNNVIDSNLVKNGLSYGIYTGADSNSYTNNRIENNKSHGIFLQSADTNTLTGNRVYNSWNNAFGLFIDEAYGNTVYNNTFDSNTNVQVFVAGDAARNNVFDSNLITSGQNYGIYTCADSNTYTNNRIENNKLTAIYLDCADTNTLTGNYVFNCRSGACALYEAHGNVFDSNDIDSSSSTGISLFGSNFNSFRASRVSGGDSYGISLTNSNANRFELNQVQDNRNYGLYVTGTSSGDTFTKNNIIPGTVNPDSAVFADASNPNNFERNWMGSADYLSRFKGSGPADSVPFRLGMVDTAAGADTVAPKAPDTAAVALTTDTAIGLSWAVVTSSEEPEAAFGLAGYRVYRGLTSDTNLWEQVGQTTSTSFVDSGLTSLSTYYYRVTAFDAAAKVNESFYSDSIVQATAIYDTSGPNVWYVNDASQAGDSWCSAIGYDTNCGLTAACSQSRYLNQNPRIFLTMF